MAKFLQSRAGQNPDVELQDDNQLTLAGLRSLIAGHFYLCQLQSQQKTPLEQIYDGFLLLHEKGLFVLLQCHQNGIIHGEAEAASWSCFNYLGDSKPFTNPVFQNRDNISRLSALLKLPEDRFYSCILFDNECELRRVPSGISRCTITWADQVERLFAEMLPNLPVQYSYTQLEALHDIFILVSSDHESNG